MRNIVSAIALAASLALFTSTVAKAGPLTDRINSGQPIRIGFSNVPIWGYPDDDGKPKGFVNEIALHVLKDMGYTNIETVVTDWGGLIPGLQANRYDIITGGLYILKSRCASVAFSEPIVKAGDSFIVPSGNPKGLNNYKDLLQKGAMFVTYSGANLIEAAKKEGLGDDGIMQVPGVSEIVAAVKSGRADAGGMTYFEAKDIASKSGGSLEATDSNALPAWTLNWVGLGFRPEDDDFKQKFNTALKKYVGTPEMLDALKQYGVTEGNLPGDTTTAWACANR